MVSYGVHIVAGGVPYNFHVDTTASVKELIEGSKDITALMVYEEFLSSYRKLSDTEILHRIFLDNTARTLEEKALPRLLQPIA